MLYFYQDETDKIRYVTNKFDLYDNETDKVPYVTDTNA